MSIRFATAKTPTPYLMSRRAAQNAVRVPGNDNPAPIADLNTVLRAALEHMTKHGLDTPKAAHREALNALRKGDREAFKRWSAICRTFDRRAANALDRLEAENGCADSTKAG